MLLLAIIGMLFPNTPLLHLNGKGYIVTFFIFASLCVSRATKQHTKAQHDPWAFTVVHALLFILI